MVVTNFLSYLLGRHTAREIASWYYRLDREIARELAAIRHRCI